MSILIHGMEMPRLGYREIRIHPDGRVTEHPLPEYPGYEENLGKAIPVPPHGRLIDVDAVSLEGGPYEYDEWCKWALEQYQNAPTIIPAEEES